MVFSYTTTNEVHVGNVRVVYGTFANTGGSTGGNIETHLHSIENCIITYLNSSALSYAPALNGTLETSGGKKRIPLTGTVGAIPIVTAADTSGFWTAFGV